MGYIITGVSKKGIKQLSFHLVTLGCLLSDSESSGESPIYVL